MPDPAPAIPRRMRTTMGDRFNFAMHTVFVPTIHLVVDFADRLDLPRLRRALRLCAEAEPVLGCRFVPGVFRAKWHRLPDDVLDANVPGEVTGDPDEVLLEYAAREFDPLAEPCVAALVVHGPAGDRLILKVNHQVADAGGVKDIGYLLAGLYRRLETEPDFRPAPNFGSRSMWQVLRLFIPRHLGGLLRRLVSETREARRPLRSVQMPATDDLHGGATMILRRFDPARVARLRRYAKDHGATLNDIYVAALMRALVGMVGRRPDEAIRLGATVDLRRYLPGERAAAICNLSSFFTPFIGAELGADFPATLRRVRDCTHAMKKAYIGLPLMMMGTLFSGPNPFFLERRTTPAFFRYNMRNGNIPAGMTNLGPIDPARLDFGKPPVARAEMLPPLCRPPFFFTALSGYCDHVTLSVAIYASSIPVERAGEFFDRVDAELPR